MEGHRGRGREHRKRVGHPFDIVHAFHATLRGLSELWYSGETRTLIVRAAAVEEKLNRSLYWQLEKEWIRALELDSLSACLAKWTEISRYLEQERVLMPVVKQLAGQLLHTISKVCSSPVADAELTKSRTHMELKRLIADAIATGFSYRSRFGRQTTDHKEINRVVDYLNEHYQEEITVGEGEGIP